MKQLINRKAKGLFRFIAYILLPLVGGGLAVVSCSDEPDSEYFYTFNGEMMSDYLKNRSEYSRFTYIVEKAELMDLLATYGHYTCFVPSDTAVGTYLRERGLTNVEQLSKEDCDTIARTHLISNMYSTFEMLPSGTSTSDASFTLPTPNMLGRYITTSSDEVDGKPVVRLEGTAYIYNELQNDTVENGIMQPVNMVIEKSNSYIADIVRSNNKISIFYEALVATDVLDDILLVADPTWESKGQPKYYYTSDFWKEVAWVPDTKKYGYTIFVEPDSIYLDKFEEMGISTANGNLRALYELACRIYDRVYEADVNAPGHSFDNLTDSVNPLRRFIQYHILTRSVPSADKLTAPIMNKTNEAFGFDTKLVNPEDWYQTMLPHTLMKFEQLTVDQDSKGNNYRGKDVGLVGERFINRRYASPDYNVRGAWINSSMDTENEHDAVNGHYFYVDDIVAFSYEVQKIVQNTRIRMDFSSIFPEVMTNNLRQNGDPFTDDASGTPDDSSTPKNGRNFYFPLGYLDGVTFTNCYCVLRRPHINFWSWQGDEWNLFGDYDFTFRIPPVPESGEYQLRLGFCALPTRGVMQTYFDGIPQGIPLDMTKFLDSELYIGNRFFSDETLNNEKGYNKMSDEAKAEEQKLLKNLGAYRDGRSQYHFSSDGNKNYFTGNARTYRRILCQTYIDASKDHYLRFRVASDGKQGNNNEFMLDFFEIVPKSVYSVDGTGDMEDDL
ncbi:MAG: fasciclin domain-containing protein [Prevotella sp.]|nr:fasciclin domain-containing protein [Prevotella sp.]